MSDAFDLSNVALTSALATAASSALLPVLGVAQTGHAAAPFNATSHIVWGDAATRIDAADLAHTVVGAVLNAGAMTSWAVVQELLFGTRVKGSVGKALVAGAATAAIAYVTDYHVVPERFTPGFEKRLSKGTLALVYVTLAASLAVGIHHRDR